MIRHAPLSKPRSRWAILVAQVCMACCQYTRSHWCCRGNADQTWFAQLRLLFSYRSNHSGKMIAAAFVRWYDAADTRKRLPSKGRLLKGRQDRPLRGMQRLKWATLKEGRTELPHYDCILADRIIRPVYIQPDPTCPQRFYFNHYVK